MSAILLLGMGLLKAGDHVVCSHSVFGSTVMLFGREFAKFGVETTFVSQTDVAAWQAAVKPNTKLLFAESPTNPLTEVCDIRALADDRPRRRRLAGRRQLLLHAGAAAAGRVRRRPASSIPAPSTSTARAGSSPARICAQRADRQREVRAGDAQRRHVALAVQRLGGAEGPGDALDPDAGAERAGAGAGALARDAADGRARLLPGPRVASRSTRWRWRSSRGCGGAVVSFVVAAPAGDPRRRAGTPST